MTKILGLSFYYHDSAAALLIDGEPVAMAQEERFSRKKHDPEFPESAIKFVLDSAGLKSKDLDYIVFYEKPFAKLARILKTNLDAFPFCLNLFSKSIREIFLKKLWVRELISRKLNFPADKILFSDHHLSHASSSFFCSPYKKSAILTIDGVGEEASTTIGFGNENSIEILKKINFPDSLGLLYSAFTAFLGFEVNEGEYKVMGMAPYGKPIYADKVRKMIKFIDDGSYKLDLSYFKFHRSAKEMYSKKFIKEFQDLGPDCKADISASIQAVLEESVIRLAEEAYRLTNSENLCIAGGVGLNSVANWKILQNTPFKNIFIQPASGDAGGALGAALSVYHQGLDKPRNYIMKHAHYGQDHSSRTIKEFLDNSNIKYDYHENEDKLMDSVAGFISEGKVIGWFHGKSEWGPRALGARSILADPRVAEMKDIVNKKIKFREPFRPFAASILAEQAENFLDIINSAEHFPLRFMLYVVNVREDKQKEVPAITHIDGTTRPQLVFKDESPRYYKLIGSFHKITGIPLILNTSFNLRGEPIVNTPKEAYSTFIRSGLDILVLENYMIHK